jgi:protein phosphatase PTC1
VCSDQEAVDLIRNITDPQEASKLLVDHALARFSTDNLSVMIVRFDPKKLQSNTASDIGIASDPATKSKGAVSEVEMIVGEARRHSGMRGEQGALTDVESEEVKEKVFNDIREEEQEPGPELIPEGGAEAARIFAEKQKESAPS